MTERPQDGQIEALRAFLRLAVLQPEWAGRLVFVRGLGGQGQAFSIAASIAGAASLAIEGDAAGCRWALKAGACDFLVNTVDEALRILKNELRKRKPVIVALQSSEDAALQELAERGVVADLFVGANGVTREEDFRLDSWMQERGLELRRVGCSTVQELQELDRRLTELIPVADSRRRWTVQAPVFFHRDRPFGRAVCLTAEEFATLGQAGQVAT